VPRRLGSPFAGDVAGTMARATERTQASDQKRIILAFRLQTVLVIIALLAFSTGSLLLSTLAFRIAAVYLLSNILLTALPPRYFSSPLLIGTMLVADVVFVSACIYFSGTASGDTYLLYFLAILMAALTRDLKTTVIVAVTISAVYLWVSVSSGGGREIASPQFLLRIPLFFVTAFFSGFLANQARNRELERRKAKLATSELKQQLRETKRLEQETLTKYRYLYLHHRNIMASINSGILVVNTEGVITTFNREAEHITGLPSSDVLGKQAARYTRLHPLTDRLAEAYSMGRLYTSEEAVLQTGNGGPMPIGYTTSLLRDQNNEVTGAIATFRDLSEVKELRDQIQRSERLAFLGEMAASVAHEIRNPLNSISGFAQLLCERLAAENRLHKFAEIIVEETTRIEKIVAQTLHFVKDDTIPYESLDFNEVINSTTSSMRDKLASRSISVVLDLNPYLPYVSGNEVQLRQVCTNLVTNSIHALEQEGEIRITTSTDGKCVTAVFEDTGPGVPSEIREKIFNPFFTTKTHGTGLGLAVSQKILEDHDGVMRLLDRPGKGAVFEIRLPVDESAKTPESFLRVAANAKTD
jgi:two-component system sensor histidine kinase PilS (NtrC family)